MLIAEYIQHIVGTFSIANSIIFQVLVMLYNQFLVLIYHH